MFLLGYIHLLYAQKLDRVADLRFDKLDRNYYQLRKDTIYSKYYTLGENRETVDVYVPFNFDTYPNQQFQVVYLFNNSFPQIDIDNVVHKVFAGLLPPIIFVDIKHDFSNMYVDSIGVHFSRLDSAFNDYFTKELIPYIHQRYHTSSFKTLVVGGGSDAAPNYSIYLMNHTQLFNAYVLFPLYPLYPKDYDFRKSIDLPHYIDRYACFKTNYICQFLQKDSHYQLTVYVAPGGGDRFASKNYMHSIYDSLISIHNNRIKVFLQVVENAEHATVEPYAFANSIDYIYSDYVNMIWQMQANNFNNINYYYGYKVNNDSLHPISLDMVKKVWQEYGMDIDISPYTLMYSIYPSIYSNNGKDISKAKNILDYFQSKLPHNIAYSAYLASLYQTIGDEQDAIKLYIRAISTILQSTMLDYHIYVSKVATGNLIDVNIINSLYIPLVSLYAKDSNYKTVYQHIESIPFINPIEYYYLANIAFTHHYKLEVSIAYLKKWINYLKTENSIKEQPYQYQFDTSAISNLNNNFPIPLMFKNPNLSNSYILLSKLYASIGKEAEARKYALLGESK